jgi:hypothetical protein
MRLNEYVWSRNPRGMHNKAATTRLNTGKMIDMKMGWAKLVTLSADYLDVVEQLLTNNITPIIRIFRPRMGAIPPLEMMGTWRRYYEVGVRWFEFYNEPNLENEWPQGFQPDYQDTAGTIAPLMQNWLAWAEAMIAMGAYPAFPALAETAETRIGTAQWINAMLNYLAENYYDRFRAVASNGLWCATHPYTYNHFYQENPGSSSPRSPESENANEGGWRFDYPYDSVSQADKPGITAVSGPPEYPLGDIVGLTAVGTAFMTRFAELFGGGAIPVVGTEGGIYPVPNSPADFQQIDARYPGVTWTSHGEATLAMFNWLASADSPPWMFGVTLWKEDNYLETFQGDSPATRRMIETPTRFKEVLPVEPLDGPGPRALAAMKGPGPIHGAPDYHFLIITPGFNLDWFFSHGQAYWERYRPAILTSINFIANMNYKKSLGVTVLASSDSADYIMQQIRERWPNVWVDMLKIDSADELARVLNERVTNGRRFG